MTDKAQITQRAGFVVALASDGTNVLGEIARSNDVELVSAQVRRGAWTWVLDVADQASCWTRMVRGT
jgi:hypothetical protein